MQPCYRCVRLAFAVTCIIAGTGPSAWALPHWKPRPAGPVTAYAPQMRHFIVVAPVPAVASPVVAPAGPISAEAGAPYLTGDPVVVPYATRHARAKARVKQAISPAPAPDQILWQQQVEPVPAYPWGWFGARRHTENFGHRRYLRGELDWSLLRGD